MASTSRSLSSCFCRGSRSWYVCVGKTNACLSGCCDYLLHSFCPLGDPPFVAGLRVSVSFTPFSPPPPNPTHDVDGGVSDCPHRMTLSA